MGIQGWHNFLRIRKLLKITHLTKLGQLLAGKHVYVDINSILYEDFVLDEESIKKWWIEKKFTFSEGVNKIQNLLKQLTELGVKQVHLVMDGDLSYGHPKTPTVERRHKYSINKRKRGYLETQLSTCEWIHF